MSDAGKVHRAIDLMRGIDFCTLLFTAAVVGLYVANELRDIKLCEFTLRQYAGESSAAWASSTVWALCVVRQFGALPMMVVGISDLVLWRGSDSLSICFNALAVLFILDVDNAIFSHWLSFETRVLMGESKIVHIGTKESRLLHITKQVHTILVVVAIGSVILLAGASMGGDVHKVPGFLCFPVGGVCEAVLRAQAGEGKYSRLLVETFVASVAGITFAFMLAGGGVGALLGAPYQ
jgi:hypothetical protein